jgi:hypothetical protein
MINMHEHVGEGDIMLLPGAHAISCFAMYFFTGEDVKELRLTAAWVHSAHGIREC